MKTIKNPYENAEVHIVLLDNSDVIATSGGGWNGGTGGMDGGEGGGWDVN
ncbi:MAG: hypothetical protein J6B48_09210 [Clostridia bacterium]|nr:hypothetical protein [Clostridia bacterium]